MTRGKAEEKGHQPQLHESRLRNIETIKDKMPNTPPICECIYICIALYIHSYSFSGPTDMQTNIFISGDELFSMNATSFSVKSTNF